MASTSDHPTVPRTEREVPRGEMEPLLGNAGGAAQAEGSSIVKNLYQGKFSTS